MTSRFKRPRVDADTAAQAGPVLRPLCICTPSFMTPMAAMAAVATTDSARSCVRFDLHHNQMCSKPCHASTTILRGGSSCWGSRLRPLRVSRHGRCRGQRPLVRTPLLPHLRGCAGLATYLREGAMESSHLPILDARFRPLTPTTAYPSSPPGGPTSMSNCPARAAGWCPNIR